MTELVRKDASASNGGEISIGYQQLPGMKTITYKYTAVTSAYTILSSDMYISASGASNYAVTLPSASAVGAGKIYIIKSNMNSGILLNIATTSSQTIDGVNPGTTPRTIARFESLQLISNGTGWEIF